MGVMWGGEFGGIVKGMNVYVCVCVSVMCGGVLVEL